MEETTVIEETTPAPEHGMVLTQEALYYLNEGAGWAKFLGILGFVACGIILIAAIFAGSIFNTIGRMSPNPTAMPAFAGVFISIIYVLMAILYFFPALYLYQFADNMQQAIKLTDNTQIAIAANKLKSYFKFWGIFTIICLALMVLMVLIPLAFVRH